MLRRCTQTPRYTEKSHAVTQSYDFHVSSGVLAIDFDANLLHRAEGRSWRYESKVFFQHLQYLEAGCRTTPEGDGRDSRSFQWDSESEARWIRTANDLADGVIC